MKRFAPDKMTSTQLVERFAEIALQQDHAISRGETAKYNRLFCQMREIEGELKSRPGDQRTLLGALFDHSNIQVRLQAARATLAVMPEAARNLLEEIANSRKYPQAGDAGMSLDNLDRGIYRPT